MGHLGYIFMHFKFMSFPITINQITYLVLQLFSIFKALLGGIEAILHMATKHHKITSIKYKSV
jgi:hypothetical protein